jgi:hypothetical protein
MLRKLLSFISILALVLLGCDAASAEDQSPLVQPKPLRYVFVMDWAIPRQGAADMSKQQAVDASVLEKAFNSGQLVGYGQNEFILHAQGKTHRTFWTADSFITLIKVYEELKKAGALTAPVLHSATSYAPRILESRYYNAKPGASSKGGYTYEAVFQFLPGTPLEAVDIAAKSFLVPMFEKLLTTGAIEQYQIAAEGGMHTTNGKFFLISFSGKDPGIYEKFGPIYEQRVSANPAMDPWWYSWNDLDKHFDYFSSASYSFK